MRTASPLLVADFALDDLNLERLPRGVRLVEEGVRRGADWIAADLWATADDWGLVHPRGHVPTPDGGQAAIAGLALAEAKEAALHDGPPCTLEEVLLAAHKAGRGVLFRIRDVRAIPTLAGGLGVMGGEGPAPLRGRFLAAVRDTRAGRRLRTEAPDAPSALELVGEPPGVKGRLWRRFPNLHRAAADADDLIVPADVYQQLPRRDGLAARLVRRGARLWLSEVAPGDVGAWTDPALAGLLVRHPWPTG
jgi:hypothetical protein